MLEDLRRRRFPMVGAGTGVWSFVHIDDAAAATVAAVERGAPGVYQIVDDDPAPVSAWLPELAAAVGARPPRRLPAWVARLVAGEHAVVMMTEVRGASNAKARRELGWRPAWPSWRQGFRDGLDLPAARPGAA
jgi:2-alkyl-3-oxoalkanoate reductase